jgi:predicted XRE-type DNA-binding protein
VKDITTMSDTTRFTESSGNVFADLGLPEPEIALAKAKLALRLADIIEERGLTQTAAGEVLGIDQPKVSMIVRGRLKDFSIERLAQLLTKFNQDIEISVRPYDREGRFIATVPAPDERVLAAAGSAKKRAARFA